MADLHEDLAKYENELFTKGDLKAGIKLLAELSGMAAIAIACMAGVALAAPIFGAIGIALGEGTQFGSITMPSAHIRAFQQKNESRCGWCSS
jgi:hypothetical protein